jgi:hypothetical protein
VANLFRLVYYTAQHLTNLNIVLVKMWMLMPQQATVMAYKFYPCFYFIGFTRGIHELTGQAFHMF